MSSFVVGDWKASAAKKAGTNMTVEGGLVLWSNYRLSARKRLTFAHADAPALASKPASRRWRKPPSSRLTRTTTSSARPASLP